MRDEIYQDLANYAMKLGLGIISSNEFDPSTSSCIDYQRKMIIVNKNYRKPKQVIFQLAHEIGHYLNGDDFGRTVFFSPAMMGYEGRANRTGIKLLLPYYLEGKDIEHVNTANFMEYFDIPMSCESAVIDEINNYYN